MLETTAANFGPIRRKQMKDENRQDQGQEGPPDPSALYSFDLGLTPEQVKNISIEDARREENFCLRTSCMPRL
jgi:hypothetical protein